MKRTEYFALITAAITLWTTVAHGMVVCARDDGTGKPREGSKLVLKYQCRIGKEVEVGIAYDPGTGSVRLSRAVVSGGLTVTDGDESVSVLAGMCGSFDTTGCYEGPRFDGSGSTILDPVTGLEWEKKNASDSVPDLTNPHDADNGYTWCERAGDACAVSFPVPDTCYRRTFRGPEPLPNRPLTVREPGGLRFGREGRQAFVDNVIPGRLSTCTQEGRLTPPRHAG